jgi:hypothetical protein
VNQGKPRDDVVLLTVNVRLQLEPLQHYRAMEAFCRQRAKMDGEDESFWLAEAELLAELAGGASRVNGRGITSPNGVEMNEPSNWQI